jgi:hypothetical protein
MGPLDLRSIWKHGAWPSLDLVTTLVLSAGGSAMFRAELLTAAALLPFVSAVGFIASEKIAVNENGAAIFRLSAGSPPAPAVPCFQGLSA